MSEDEPKDAKALLAVLAHRVGAIERDVSEIKDDSKAQGLALNDLSKSVAVMAAKMPSHVPTPPPPPVVAASVGGGAAAAVVAMWEAAKTMLGVGAAP